MIYKYLPYFLFKPLFGDRKKFGLTIDENDSDYKLWQNECYLKFYADNQKGTIGKYVNNMGFKIMTHVDLSDKIVLEVGPGSIDHLDFNKSKPEKYVLADIKQDFLSISEKRLISYGIENIEKIKVMGIDIPLEDNSVDVIITFHQLEHVFELEKYLLELKRVLKNGGILIGAVPTEGGFAWGFGRFLTSRRYVKKTMNFNYDKIICWEHPNFINKIDKLIKSNFKVNRSIKRPFRFLPFDFNLSWSFICINEK